MTDTAPRILEHQVRDLGLAEAGRHQIRLAEHEMPGLMALRRRYADAQPLAGHRIAGSLHMTVQTAVLIETLVALGADVRWASCNIFSTQDEAAAAVVVGNGTVDAPAGVPVFAWKGETLTEYWACTNRIFDFAEGPTLILDDGGDATMLVHRGRDAELAGTAPVTPEGAPEELRVIDALIERTLEDDAQRWTRIAEQLRGVTEETTTGVHRLEQLFAEGRLLFPAINVNDSVTKSKFDNRYGIRHSLPDGLNRATDVLIGGKTAFVVGYGDVGKGAAEALRFQVARVEDELETADIWITTTGNEHVLTLEHLQSMKHLAIVANVGHFDNEIDIAALERSGAERVEIKPQVHEWRMPGGRSILVLSEGRLMNLGNATGHPSFVMSNSFSNQVLAQIELATKDYEVGVYRLPKALDEEVARLHLDALGARLTELTPRQAAYIGVPVEGPFKPEHYRY